MKKTIEPGVAEVLHTLENGEVEGEWTRLADQSVDKARWQEHRTLVIQHADGTVWGIGYSFGLTEYQDHTMPWRDSKDRPIELERLYAHQITTTEYRDKPAQDPVKPLGGESAEVEAWRLLLNGAESVVEDAMNEDPDENLTDEQFDAIRDRAMELIHELRERHGAAQ